MADKELRVHLKADDDITPAAKKAKGSLDDIPDKKTVQVEAKGFDDLAEKAGALPGPLGEAASLVGQLGAAGGVGALAAGMFAAADAAADMAIEAKTTADLTGSTVAEASKLQNLWARTGAGANDLNDVLLQMNGVLAQSPELAKQIGVNLNDGKNIQERFVELTDMLAAGQLTAVEASQLFGEEGVRQVGKLRTMYGGLSDDLEKMPAPVDDKDVQQAIEMQNAVAELKATLSATVGIVGKELVPLFGDLADVANSVAAAMPGGKEGGGADALKFVREWGTGIGLIAKGLSAVTGGDEITAKFVPAAKQATVSAGEVADAYVKLIGKAAAHEAAVAEVSGAYTDYVVEAIEAAAGAQAFNDAVGSTDFQAAELEGAVAGMAAFSDQFFALDRLASDSEEAFAGFNKAITENGFTFDLATEAGRNNQKALEDVAATLDTKLAAAYDSADGDMETFKSSASTIAQDTLTRLQDELGLSTDETNALATELGLLPADIETRYRLSGDAEAKFKLGLLQASIAALPKDVQTRVNQQIIMGDYQGALATVNGYYASHPAKLPVTPYLTSSIAGLAGGAAGGARTATATGVTATATGPAAYATPTDYYAPVPSIVVNVPPAPPTTLKVEAGVIGNRFDVDRAVTRAFRRHQRLNGRRP